MDFVVGVEVGVGAWHATVVYSFLEGVGFKLPWVFGVFLRRLLF